ncbi:MAG: beta-galactosidase [Spirochaetes bacterium]|nr:beta-galactosidase [Spirochaetota bacterium]
MKAGRFCTIIAAIIVSSMTWAANEPTVLFDASSAAGWDTRRDTARVAREFSVSDIAQKKDDGAALLWTFTPRSITFNDLWYPCTIGRKFARMKIIIDNRGAAFKFSIKTIEANNAEWTITPIPLAERSGVQEITVPVTELRQASWSKDANGRLDFPLNNIVLIAFDVRTNTSYSLAIRSISLEYDALPQLDVLSLDIPSAADAGAPLNVSLTAILRSGSFTGNGAAFELRAPGMKGPVIKLVSDAPASNWRPGERRTFKSDGASLGIFSRGGTFTAVCTIDGYDVELLRGTSVITPMVTVRERTRGMVRASVAAYNGVPTMFINGVPRPSLAFSAYQPSAEVFSDFNKAGVTFSCIMATPTDHGYGLARTAWKSEREFDFTQIDERMDMVLAGDSNAYAIPRIYVAAPLWWCEKNPDDIVTHDPGDGKPVVFKQSGKPVPSWASERWREDTAAAIRKLIAHVEASPYADRIIGYHIASGTTEEWMQWAANDRLWADYSPANVKKFRTWLTAKYGSDAVLKKAWRNNAVTLAGAQIPSKNDRLTCRLGTLRDPETEQPSIDYSLYTSDLVAETIGYFCAVVKDATKRTKLAGAFYGYVLQLISEQRQQNAGHLALRKVWDIPDLDFIACPTSYAFRALGTGTTHMMSLLDGAMRSGKIWIDENDIRTSISPGKPGEWGKPADVNGDILQQQRELGLVLSRGFGQWWFDVGHNRYNDPAIMKEISRLTRFGEELLTADRSPVDEIAFIVDSRALAMMEVGNVLSRPLIMSQLTQAHRIGAPIGWYDISDLQTLPPRKLYVFLNLLDPSVMDLAAIRKLRSQGRVLVYMYASGVYENGAFNPAAAERLIGFPLAHDTNTMELAVTIGENKIAPQAKGFVYAAGATIRGFFTPERTSGTVVGTLKNGKPGLVISQADGHTVIWSAGPALPASLLRRLAEMAKVHCYTAAGDVVWAAKETLALTVEKAGKRTITLPAPAAVYDVYAEKTIAENVSTFETDIADAGTKLFRITVKK